MNNPKSKKIILVFIGIFLIITLAFVLSRLLLSHQISYITDDGIYYAEISGQTTSLQFTDEGILLIATNPGVETYSYLVDNDVITLMNETTGKISVLSFQYDKEDNIVIMDGVEYRFAAKEE